MRHRDFEFTAGCLSLDFLDTLSGRTSDSAVDLLSGPDALVRWSVEAGYPLDETDSAGLKAALALRAVMGMVADALVVGERPAEPEITALNRQAATPGFQPCWEDGALVYRANEPLPALLSTLAADAILSLLGGDMDRIRRCPDCGMIFKDISRPGRRVWCSSSSGCGNRAKVRRHRARAQARERKETPT